MGSPQRKFDKDKHRFIQKNTDLYRKKTKHINKYVYMNKNVSIKIT